MIVVPTIHPSALLRSSDDARSEGRFKHIVEADVLRAAALMHRAPAWDESPVWRDSDRALFPDLAAVGAFVHGARGAEIIWVDVEATGKHAMECKLICVGVGYADRDGIEHTMCIPFIRRGDLPYWDAPGEESIVRSLLTGLFREVPTGFQNGSFDTVVLWRHGMPVHKWTHDTMQGHHVIDGEMPHGLAFLASVYTEIPYYKDSVKGDEAWVHKDDLTLRLYNLRDVLCTMRARAPIWREIQTLKLMALYRTEIRQMQIMSAATVRGICVDEDRRKELGDKLRAQESAALDTLRRIAGDQTFNPASPVQLADLLFTKLRFPIVSRTTKGKPSTDKNAMVLLAVQAETDDQIAALTALAKWRRTSKLISTYVDGLPILGDGRLHPAWNLLPVTGRFSSTPNAQNWPYSVKTIFRAGPGMKLVSIDLSQAELRGIAYYSGDPDLLRAYREGHNLHTVNASLLFRVRNPGADTNPQTEQYLAETCPTAIGMAYTDLPQPPKDRWKLIRRLAKNFVFGDNYGATAETLFDFIRAARDPETDQPYFPDLDLGTIEALKLDWEQRLHPSIPRWWQRVTSYTNAARKFVDPYLGRIRWFRGGFKRNEILNFPIQTLVASFMLERGIEISDRLLREAPGSAIILQVHDSITVEAPEHEVEIVSRIMREVFSRPFELGPAFTGGPSYSDAVLPPDDVTVGIYLSEV